MLREWLRLLQLSAQDPSPRDEIQTAGIKRECYRDNVKKVICMKNAGWRTGEEGAGAKALNGKEVRLKHKYSEQARFSAGRCDCNDNSFSSLCDISGPHLPFFIHATVQVTCWHCINTVVTIGNPLINTHWCASIITLAFLLSVEIYAKQIHLVSE